jgi:hypothetical protein
MKRWKKLALILIVLIAISQIPFAYRRYKFARLHKNIDQLNLQRLATSSDGAFAEYKGVMHVHSFLGGHSTGTFEDMIAAAQANNLDFVVMTEHPSKNYDTAAMTLKGTHGGVLFVNGNEIGTANQDRLLVLPGDDLAATASNSSTQDILTLEKTKGALALVAYPQDFKSWSANEYDGVEVYNLFTNARRVNPFVMFFDGLWSYRSYPNLLFASFYERPAENLKLWDEALVATGRRLVATAGNDAHSNVGLGLIDSSGKTLLGIKLDPYERSFRMVRVHVLIPGDKALSSDSLLGAIRDGHCFIAFDLFSDAAGFSFSATNGNERKIQGDEIGLTSTTRLIESTPVSSRVVLFRNGGVVQERSGVTRTEFEIAEKGIYRVEVYLPQLPQPVGAQPWIISNPIYVR